MQRLKGIGVSPGVVSGRAVVLISHDLELVFRMADRIEVLRLGRVQGVRRCTETTREEILGLITGLLHEEVSVPA